MPRLMTFFIALFGAALSAACAPYAPGDVSLSLDDGQAGRVWFVSSDVYDFPQMTAGGAPTRIIHGDLSLPRKGEPLKGAVILSHGSGGPGSRQERYVEPLTKRGYAVFLLDHFAPRDVTSTVRDQIRITEQGMLADVAAAQRLLATHPRLEANRIGHIGWSKGAVVSVLGAVDRLAGYAEGPAPLAFAVAFYPFCGFDLSKERLSAPLLVQIGAEDDWTPAEPCVTLVTALDGRGKRAAIDVYPGARHGFDSSAPDITIDRAITIRRDDPDCLLTVSETGQTRSMSGRHSLDSIDARTAFLEACGVRGVGFGGNAEAGETSMARVLAFIETHLP